MTTDALTLPQFLEQCIAADEAAARAATPGPWYADDLYLTVTGEPYRSAREAYDRGDSDEDCWVISEGDGGGVSSHNLPHIARHDPARVLAQCEALRAVVALHAPNDDTVAQCNLCNLMIDTYNGDWEFEVWPCRTLRALARIWSSHPDFDPSWAE